MKRKREILKQALNGIHPDFELLFIERIQEGELDIIKIEYSLGLGFKRTVLFPYKATECQLRKDIPKAIESAISKLLALRSQGEDVKGVVSVHTSPKDNNHMQN